MDNELIGNFWQNWRACISPYLDCSEYLLSSGRGQYVANPPNPLVFLFSTVESCHTKGRRLEALTKAALNGWIDICTETLSITDYVYCKYAGTRDQTGYCYSKEHNIMYIRLAIMIYPDEYSLNLLWFLAKIEKMNQNFSLLFYGPSLLSFFKHFGYYKEILSE